MKKIFVLIILEILATALYAQEPEKIVYLWDNDVAKDFQYNTLMYCREIDSLCYANGVEIDADAIDIEDESQMESEAYRLLGDMFYTWRRLHSKYAWEIDVYIARFCY